MRTTIELPDWQRARLLELAARRGEKGFSELVQEAVELFLAKIDREDDQVQAALVVMGSLDDEAADRLEDSIKELRNTW